MVAARVRQGDLFLASAGPGHFPTIETLLKVAREAGGRTAIITPQPTRAAQMPADVVIHLPAQTMVDVGGGVRVLNLGTHYWAGLFLVVRFLVPAAPRVD